MKKITIVMMIAAAGMMAACKDADVASRNISNAADNFEVTRRVVFYNGITEGYMLSITGLCSLGNDRTNKEISITCKTGPKSYKKHFLGLSDNVTYFIEQVDPVAVDVYHYDVVFKPSVIIPNIQVK